MDAASIRNAINNVTVGRIEAVEVPEWGVTVYIKEMSGSERDSYQASLIEQGKSFKDGQRLNMTDVTSKLLVRVLCDADGNRIYTNNEFTVLGRQPASVLNRLAEKAREISAMTEKDVDELTGNSESATNDDSLSV